MIPINTQVISRERVAAHGEVFTAQREVNAMCDLVKDQCNDYRATFLEPACGTGNFLAEILSRKLASIPTDTDYPRKSLVALSSLYGIDILPDNVKACRKRLFDLWKDSHHFSEFHRVQAIRILNANIVCGDTLKPHTIKLTEWTISDEVTPANTFTLEEEMTGQIALNLEE